MAKRTEPMPDPGIEHPEPDTSHNEADGDEGPPTWQPGGKVTNPEPPAPEAPFEPHVDVLEPEPEDG